MSDNKLKVIEGSQLPGRGSSRFLHAGTAAKAAQATGDVAGIIGLKYFPYYQPIIDLTSGRIEGYEALARYRNTAGDICSAGHIFLNPGADLDFNLSLDRHIRLQAINTFAANIGAGYVAINISPGWVDRLPESAVLPTIRMVEEAGLDPSRVVIEITESKGDLDNLSRAVKCYHEAGMRVALDDFGAGASCIDRIEMLEPDIVKLDMRLFKKAAKGTGISTDIARSVADIAAKVGCHMVFEGVETEQEFYFGLECGCSHMQGHLFKEALPRVMNAGNTVQAVRKLQTNYLKAKSARLLQAKQYRERLAEAVLQIGHCYAGKSIALDARKLETAGVLRFFVCNVTGHQVSSNYEVTGDAIREKSMTTGYNWAHRPYFALFMARHGAVSDNLYASDTYRDHNHHTHCQTYGHFLDEQNILLVDVEVPDHTLYAD